MEDIRMMRRTAAESYQVATAATFKVWIPQDDTRISLILGSDAAATLTLSFRGDNGQAAGIILPANTSPLVLDLQHHGWLVCAEIDVKASAGTPTVTAWGSIMNER